MRFSCIQDVLAYLEKPSRYLGTEVNRIRKDPRSVHLKVALAFPDLYEIGTSHFGLQILYDVLNRRSDIAAERVFAPGDDLSEKLRSSGLPLCTLESQQPLDRFDIIGFSLLYELNYTNVLNMIDLAGIPLRASQRTCAHPLIVAGGPCVCNPEPMAPFFDAMLFGDGEEAVLKLADTLLQWRAGGSADRNVLLESWSRIEGVYIPAFFEACQDGAGFQRLSPRRDDYASVKRAIVADLDAAAFPVRPIVPFGRPVHDRLRLEISRGCSRGCRFCQAGLIYRPVRERSPETVMALMHECLHTSGFEDLSLLSLSTGDYTCLNELIEEMMRALHKKHVAVSLPSVRAGTLTPQLMSLIKKVRKTGFTIAPEAGSQRLRDIINKNIEYEDIARTVRDAFEMGWDVIKLYFMIGLPGEEQADLEAIVDMIAELKKIKPPKRRGQINVSITTFIPKPHTPFQWASQLCLEESHRRIEWLKSRLRMPGVQVKWQNPAMSMLEGVLARGDRRLADVLERAWKSGCSFDGWGDRFDFQRWQQAFAAAGVDIDCFTTRRRELDEPLPWAHMDAGVAVGFLKSQWENAFKGMRLADCRWGACHQCGVCDFKKVRPRVYLKAQQQSDAPAASCTASSEAEEFIPVDLIYSKEGPARFFGHLEQAGIFARALRRADIEMAYSRGFHPMPRLSFDDPLPVGMESEGERLRIMVACRHDCREIVEALNRQLPLGLRVTGCRRQAPRIRQDREAVQHYRVHLGDQKIDREQAARFLASSNWEVQWQKGRRAAQSMDVRAFVKELRFTDPQTMILVLAGRENRILRPADILQAVFGFDAQMLAAVRTTRLNAIPAFSTGEHGTSGPASAHSAASDPLH